jgi:hypothetical protein
MRGCTYRNIGKIAADIRWIYCARRTAHSHQCAANRRWAAAKGFLSADALKDEVVKGLGVAIRAALFDRSLGDTELARIQEIMDQFGLETPDIVASGAYDLLVQGMALRDLDQGKIRSRFQITGSIPLNLKKDEVVLWMFKGVARSEPKTNVTYAGGSQGISLRIMSGVSYRVGASKGHRLETISQASKGTGDLYVTSLGVIFSSALSVLIVWPTARLQRSSNIRTALSFRRIAERLRLFC